MFRFPAVLTDQPLNHRGNPVLVIGQGNLIRILFYQIQGSYNRGQVLGSSNQINVVGDIAEQISEGSPNIMGVMIESNLVEGRQDIVPGQPLTYGQSVTDACISWEDTVPLLDQLARSVRDRRARNM